MELTEKQKNCPYCHETESGYIKPLIDLEIDNGHHDLEMNYHEALFDPIHKQMSIQGYVRGYGEYSASTKANYCLRCGRPLTEEEDDE